LFRWGDACPVTLPTIPRSGAHPVWDLHLRPNAFGLLIARDPYRWEFCQEPGIMRGGDGGMALHAAIGRFVEWLTLATAYQYGQHGDKVYLAHLRRVFPLPL
jgi:hypothetical protein